MTTNSIVDKAVGNRLSIVKYFIFIIIPPPSILLMVFLNFPWINVANSSF